MTCHPDWLERRHGLLSLITLLLPPGMRVVDITTRLEDEILYVEVTGMISVRPPKLIEVEIHI